MKVLFTVALANPWAYQALACYDRMKNECRIIDEGDGKDIDSILKDIRDTAEEGLTEILVSISSSDEMFIYTFDAETKVWSKTAPPCMGVNL